MDQSSVPSLPPVGIHLPTLSEWIGSYHPGKTMNLKKNKINEE
jgi:hypothetical protein